MIKKYTVDGVSFNIAYPDGYAVPDFTDDELREILRRSTRHSSLTQLRELMFGEREAEKQGILAITGPNLDSIRFFDPNGFVCFADELVEWDLDRAFDLVKGLRTIRNEISALEATAAVSFTARTAKEYNVKMAKLRRFMHSMDGRVEGDAVSFTRRVYDSVVQSFCKATGQMFPWDARRVVNKSAKWFDKLPGIRVRVKKPQKNSPGQ